MHITLDVLRRFTELPDDTHAARELLDDVGLEVKRIDPAAAGVPITLELLANRGDHHCYVGLARELRGRTGAALEVPGHTLLEVGDSPYPLRLESDLCPVYTLTKLVRTGDGQIDAAAAALLDSCGLKSVGAVVDATNVANLELGQPTHAFDADTLEGPITIRRSREGEQAWPLFTEEKVTLPEGTLVIADDAKILAIAGVIGCEESKTTESTTTVLLESAAFDPVAVRKASRSLGIFTDSSARFERGSDFSMPLVGAGRVATLLAEAGWQVEGASGQVGSWSDPGRAIRLDPAKARSFLGVDTSDAEIAQRLERYGFRVGPVLASDPVTGAPSDPDAFQVMVPPHRLWDVEFAQDLYEEVVKSIGYNDTPIGLPAVDMGALPTRDEDVRRIVGDVLVGQGFYEVITDGFHGKALRDKLGITEEHPLFAHVETANALDRAYSLLKNNALGQAMDGLALNARQLLTDVKAFEFTRTFHPDATADNGICTERRIVWALANGTVTPRTWAGAGRPADAVFLKAGVAEIGTALAADLGFAPADGSYPLCSALHPNRQLHVTRDGEVIGIVGEVHPEVVKRFRIKKARPVYLELSFDALLPEGTRPAFEEPSLRHPAVRSLAFTLPHRVEAGALANHMRTSGPDWLERVAIVDRYDHEQDGAPVRTYTYELTYSHAEADRSVEELNAASEALIAAVDAAFGSAGVRLRA
jgi:phenylalanyl-tRNA synthetase beta chain